MSFQPKGIIWLADAIRSAGEHKYGKDAWIGSNLTSILDAADEARREIKVQQRFNGSSTGQTAVERAQAAGERVRIAGRQWGDITGIMRQEFVGTLPSHKGAVPVYLSGFNTSAPLPGRIWLNDRDADAMFTTGKVHTGGHSSFHPGNHGWHWFPTAGSISGRLYLVEADLQRLLQAVASKLPEVAAPLDLVEGENSSDSSSPEKKKGEPGRKDGSGALNDDPHLLEMLRRLSIKDAVSVRNAAVKVQPDAPGASPEATIKRLTKKFSDKFGTEPPPGKTWADVEREYKSNGI